MKPPFCYAELIAMAIANSPQRRATLSEIYAYIGSHFPYYQRNTMGLRKSIRVNLSYHRCFIKVPLDGRIRNNYWTVDPKYEAMFENGKYRRHPLVKRSFCGLPGAVPFPVVPSATATTTACRPRDRGRCAGLPADPLPRAAVIVTPLGPPTVCTTATAEVGGRGRGRGIGGGAVLPLAFLPDDRCERRSSQISDGNDGASLEESKLPNNEVVTEREKPALSIGRSVPDRGITSRRRNSFCSTDNVSTADSYSLVFTCDACLQSFPSKYSLIMHVFIHIDSVEPPLHVCRFCGEVFLSGDALSEHLRVKDSDRTAAAHPPAGSTKVRSSSGTRKGALTSKDRKPVPFSAIAGNNSYEHVTNVDRTPQEHYCEPSNSPLCQNKSTSPVHKKPYKCNKCSKSFAFACFLKKRDFVDSGIEAHKCEVCGKLFPKVHDLKVHLLVHFGLKSLNCDICGKLFATVDELRSHSVEHCGIEPHRCDICGKSFATPASLKSHAVVHSVVESHRCDDCGRLFARVGKFELHLSVPSGPKSYACSLCSKLFKSSLNLKRHMLVHSKNGV